jgi:hypothetical protein
MVTKRNPIPESAAASNVVVDTKSDMSPKSPLTQANDTEIALRALIQKPAADIEGAAMPAPESSPEMTPMSREGEPPPAVQKMVDGSVEAAVARVFEASPEKEFTVNAVIAELRRTDPVINENSVRFTITELKRKSAIHHVRNLGHYQILKLTKPGEEKAFPRAPLLDKQSAKSALKASPADVASDLAVLKEATAVIAKLQALIHRNQEILFQISKLRAII